MYQLVVAALMLGFPIASIAVDVLSGHDALGMGVVGKWLVFWAVGVRLLLAGVRQVTAPQAAARATAGVADPGSSSLIRELGYRNLAIGVIAVASLIVPEWLLPAAVAGVLFYGLPGVNHVLHPSRTARATTAMMWDLFTAAVLIAFCIAARH